MTKLVSVCIPAYRQPQLLLRAVHSVLCQVHCDFEVVITDDSPDDEVKLALGELLAHPKVHYFKNDQRLGAVPNWNESMNRANGAVIKILHHDDWLASPDSLSGFVDPILSGKAAVTFSACRAMRLDETELFEHHAQESDLLDLRSRTDHLAFTNFLGPPSIIAFDRALGIEFDTRYTWLSDVEFYIRAIGKAGHRLEYIDRLLVNTTAESPLQLSRSCESDKVGTFIEYVTLFSEHLTMRRRHRAVFRYFSAMLTGFDAKQRLSLFAKAFRIGSSSVVACLAAALVLPRRLAARI